tara:strand:+ start:16545 stop:17237 length:693 start_codon:yes stop_codon:yes gene_type:complete
MKKLFIFGNGEFAELAKYYFENDDKYSGIKIEGFCISDEQYKEKTFLNLPVVPLSEAERVYPKDQYNGFVAISYRKLNENRKTIFKDFKNKGYKLESYISSDSHNASFSHGENCFILENQSIQRNVCIGNNVFIWSSNHIGHSSTIQDNVYISSKVCIGGGVTVGQNSFLGMNSTVSDGVTIGKRVFVSMGSIITKSVNEDCIVIEGQSKIVNRGDKIYEKLKKNILKKY